MKNKEEMDNLVSLIIKYHLPHEQNLFMNKRQYEETSSYLKGFGSSGAGCAILQDSDPALEVDRFIYCGITFNIIRY